MNVAYWIFQTAALGGMPLAFGLLCSKIALMSQPKTDDPVIIAKFPTWRRRCRVLGPIFVLWGGTVIYLAIRQFPH